MMRLISSLGLLLLLLGGLAVATLLTVGCSLRRPTSQAGTAPIFLVADGGAAEGTVDGGSAGDAAPRPGEAVRIGGNLEARVEYTNGEFRYGDCRIPTPLPAGYPPPTPPGAIDIKSYPLVRRAAISSDMSPDWGMNFAFFPLFNHIKRREIAMTSPVEVNYAGLAPGKTRPDEFTMSFLYREPELGPTGVDERDSRVLIEDIPPTMVVAIGLRGAYRMQRVNDAIEELRDWLAGQSEWMPAGQPRALFYNGPEQSTRRLWSEVQIPVRRR